MEVDNDHTNVYGLWSLDISSNVVLCNSFIWLCVKEVYDYFEKLVGAGFLEVDHSCKGPALAWWKQFGEQLIMEKENEDREKRLEYKGPLRAI